jgi:capsular polysaccharide biosynthesis protein
MEDRTGGVMSSTYKKGSGVSKGEEDVVEIDLGRVVRAVWHNFIFVIFGTLAAALITLIVTAFFISPTYRAGFSAYINNRRSNESADTLTSGDTSAGQSLAYTYAKIMSSEAVLKEAAEKSGIDSKYRENITDYVETSVEQNTQLVDLNVTLGDPDEAYQFAKAIEETAPAYVSNVVEGSSMKIVTGSTLPTHRYGPRTKRNVLLGAAVGFLLMVLFFALRDILDKRVRSAEELEEMFEVPVIGTIPNLQSAAGGKYKYYGKYESDYEKYYTTKKSDAGGRKNARKE